MGRFWSLVSRDEDVAEMYAENQGAPSTRTVQCLHNPEDVDRYVHDYERVVELAGEHRSVAQISFLTNVRQHIVRQHIALWKKFDSMKPQEAACQAQA